MTEVKTRTCLDCVHVKTWSHPGNFRHPPDSGWECGKVDVSEEGWVEPESYMEFTEEEFAFYCARNCTDYEDNLPLTPEQKETTSSSPTMGKTNLVHEYLQSLPPDSVYRRSADLYLDDDDN